MEARKVLDTNVLIDGETGLTTILNVVEFPKSLQKNNDIIWPSKRDYLTAIEIMVDLLESGKPVPAIDVLLGAICINEKLTLVTKDHHFNYIKSVREEFSLEIRRGKNVVARQKRRIE